MDGTALKTDRILKIYSQLVNGDILRKKELAQRFHVTERSIQRDMEALRCFFAEEGLQQDIIYDRAARGYRLESPSRALLNNSEILAVCKILLESRSMRKDEMLPILDKLIACCVPEKSKKAITELLANEKHHYVEPHHKQRLLPGLWEISQAVQNHQMMEIEYERLKEPRLVRRRVKPVGIMFSEYYFYLTAFLEDKDTFENPDDLFPTIYRIDRIRNVQLLDEHFKVPYKDRFQEGEFRKRVQFMYGGKLERIRFHYTGPSIEAVLDRLPTAEIVERDETGWTVEAEVFGRGIEMWLRSQGSYIS
ncbi:WYL domain-containing protein [Flavonifractor sp. An100]|uniref:helix-turn-helix transcriptional regulator n=1 Tax=Flavonifractor sp. An100 TaxID=1965538 RepID=UPI000B398CFA|nr:WYL domain-containing protein [Flavonifractor sp. An100]OUQ76584.1 WYL domain-containing protein [Flavonifractor sp. An100]